LLVDKTDVAETNILRQIALNGKSVFHD